MASLVKLSSAINLSIDNIIVEGLNDTFPRPFEVELLRDVAFRQRVYEAVRNSLENTDNEKFSLSELKPYPLHHVLIPKKDKYDFRRCALIHPLDVIKYSTLVWRLAQLIEAERVDKDKGVVFSYRFLPGNGLIFDVNYSYTAFGRHISKKIRGDGVNALVKCDIANFYDRLNIHRLESILLSISPNKFIVKSINELLLYWSNRDSYGLPVGSNASRLLAEASLLEVDNYLLSHNVDFCRFVDDYRMFAPDAKTAHYWLSLLIERLSLEGLSLNMRKTDIEDVSDKKSLKFSFIGAGNGDNSSDPVGGENLSNINRMFTGYSGTIPTKFRESTENEQERVKRLNEEELFGRLKGETLLSESEFKDFCKALLYKNRFDLLVGIPELLNKFPQFTPYVIDMLTKHEEKIPSSIRIKLSRKFSKQLINLPYLPEYIAVSIVRLLGSSGYKNKSELMKYFRQLKRNAGHYIGRATLESLENVISRGDVLEIRQYFIRADHWEKRQIIKIVNRNLHDDEKRAWLKNVSIHEKDDMFAVGVYDIKGRTKQNKPKELTKKVPKVEASPAKI